MTLTKLIKIKKPGEIKMLKQTIAAATAIIALSVNAAPVDKKAKVMSTFTQISEVNAAKNAIDAQIAYERLRAADRDLYDIEVYSNYKADPADGVHAPIAQRIYFKMTAPQYFKAHNLEWKDENAKYWN